MRTSAAGVLGVVLGGLALACHSTDKDPVSALSAGGFSASHSASGSAALVRWDIVSLTGAGIAPGGPASALTSDGSVLTLTGSGTFAAPAGDGGTSSAVTGGGTWATSGPIGSASGTYKVTGLVRWDKAPGTPPPLADLIGNPAERSAGLAVLRIAYSDGSRGTLVVSCNFVDTSDDVFEGIIASKGFVYFFDRVAPVAGVNANRTLFHVSG